MAMRVVILISLILCGCSGVKIITEDDVQLPIEPIPEEAKEEVEKSKGEISPGGDISPGGGVCPGEKLIYKVEWLGINVGEATIEVEDIVEVNGEEAYKIKLAAKTNRLAAKIFPLNNIYLSYIGIQTGASIKSEAYRQEGRRIKREKTIFDRDNHKAYWTDLLNNRQRTIDVPQNTYDVLGAAYYFRSLDVRVGDTITYHVFSNGKVYKLYAAIKKKEYVKLPDFKVFESFRIEPYIIRDEKVDKRAKVVAYFSVDKRLPVYIILRGPVFTRISIYLQGIEEGRLAGAL